MCTIDRLLNEEPRFRAVLRYFGGLYVRDYGDVATCVFRHGRYVEPKCLAGGDDSGEEEFYHAKCADGLAATDFMTMVEINKGGGDQHLEWLPPSHMYWDVLVELRCDGVDAEWERGLLCEIIRSTNPRVLTLDCTRIPDFVLWQIVAGELTDGTAFDSVVRLSIVTYSDERTSSFVDALVHAVCKWTRLVYFCIHTIDDDEILESTADGWMMSAAAAAATRVLPALMGCVQPIANWNPTVHGAIHGRVSLLIGAFMLGMHVVSLAQCRAWDPVVFEDVARQLSATECFIE